MAEELHSFKRGYGDLTGNYLNEVTLRLRQIENAVGELDRRIDRLNKVRLRDQVPENIPHRVEVFPAMLTAYQELEEGQDIYEYAWKECIPDPTVSVGVLTNPGRWVRPTATDGDLRSSTVDADEFAAPAYNGMEAGNIGSGVSSGGVDVSNQPTYPATWYLQPIRGHGIPGGGNPGTSGVWTDARAPVVPMHMKVFIDDDGESHLIFWFSAVNVHDGTCP